MKQTETFEFKNNDIAEAEIWTTGALYVSVEDAKTGQVIELIFPVGLADIIRDTLNGQ